ncbi:MAG: metal-dependent hydrolase [Planctomycetota bacterium]
MPTTLTYLGHAGFLIEHDGKTICIDPFLEGNDLATHEHGQIDADFVAFTHGHADHFNNDGLSIAKRCQSTVIAPYELAMYCGSQGVGNLEPINPGGAVDLPIGRLVATSANHSSSYEGQYMGACVGYVLHVGDHAIFHMGDTGLTADFDLVRRLEQPTVCLVPVGDRLTMGVREATVAMEMLQPKIAVPMHYATFPLLTGDPAEFTPPGVDVKAMSAGDTLELD